MTKPIDLDALEALASAATAGPWRQHHEGVRYVRSDNVQQYVCDCFTTQAEADAAFIAACRDAVPALVAEVRRLRDASDELIGLMRDELTRDRDALRAAQRTKHVDREQECTASVLTTEHWLAKAERVAKAENERLRDLEREMTR